MTNGPHKFPGPVQVTGGGGGGTAAVVEEKDKRPNWITDDATKCGDQGTGQKEEEEAKTKSRPFDTIK